MALYTKAKQNHRATKGINVIFVTTWKTTTVTLVELSAKLTKHPTEGLPKQTTGDR